MSVILFAIVLAILIFVHELGHFLIAKKSGIKVSEFGIGFPPRLWGKKKGETTYSINAIPFGGFVKILGEDPMDPEIQGEDKARSMTAKSRPIQIAVLAGGVFFNVLFAWLLISLGYMIGLPTPEGHSGQGIVQDAKLMITTVSPDTPAFISGFKPGDVILEVTSEDKYILDELSPTTLSNFIEAHGRDGLKLNVARGEEVVPLEVVGEMGIVQGKVAIGISMDMIGILKLPPVTAFLEAGNDTIQLVRITAVSILSFLFDSFTGNGDLSQVTGPVGIVGLVGDVTQLGFVYLLSFTALISINLAVINLLPVPALDGGRILFVLIEAVLRRPIPPKVAQGFNAIGFVLLIILMVVVTVHDVLRIF